MFFRPMAGMLGVLVLPAVGAIRSHMRKGGPLTAARQAECAGAAAALSTTEADEVELLFRSLTTPKQVKQRRAVESMRRKEMAAASTLGDLSPEEAQEMASRKWWKGAIPPPRPVSRSRASSISSAPDVESLGRKTEELMAEPGTIGSRPSSRSAARSETQSLASEWSQPHRATPFPKSTTPPPLPPRKRG